jgi:hypothetical protein
VGLAGLDGPVAPPAPENRGRAADAPAAGARAADAIPAAEPGGISEAAAG